MAKVVAKSEFMTNAFPAGQLKLRGEFFVVEDDHGEHMVFSVDSRGKLCVILKGNSGHNELVNLSDKFGLSDGQTVKALAVSQNRDGTIHVVFSTRKDDTSDEILVLRPMLASKAEWTRSFSRSEDFYVGEQSSFQVRQIMLGTSNDCTEEDEEFKAFPHFYIVLKETGRTTEDIWAFSASKQEKKWKRQRGFEMTVNPNSIIDKCVGNLRRYRGLFVLSRDILGSGTEIALRFIGLTVGDTPVLKPIIQKVPEGACRLASFDNASGYSDLIIGGKQLTWRSSAQLYAGSTAPYSVLSDDVAYADAKQLTIAQSTTTLSTWSLNTDQMLSYQEFAIPEDPTTAPTSRTPIIPLVKSQSDRFYALQNPRLGQKIFVIDQGGAMKMLEQDNQSSMWQTAVDVMIPQSDELIEFTSHTVEIRVNDSDSDAPLSLHPLKISCSTTAELLINGKSVRGSPEGIVATADEGGILTVILKSEELAAPILTVGDTPTSPKKLKDGPLVVDPASKLWLKVGNLKTPKDLKDMQLPDGSSFVKSGVSDKELQDSVNALQQLSKIRTEAQVAPKASQVSLMASSSAASSSSSIGDRLWGMWYWIKDKIKQGYEWTVKMVGGAWNFIVTIAGKVWNFVLDTAMQIAAAAQKIFEVICDGIEKVKNFFEFIFSWEDILDVKNVLVNLTTQGLLWGVDAVDMLQIQANDFFDDLRAKARALKKTNLPAGMQKLKAGNDATERNSAKAGSDSKSEETLNSPASRYGTYHLTHSGGPGGPNGGQSAVQRLLQRLGTVWQQIEQLLSRCKVNISALLNSKDITVDDVLQKVGVDLLEDTIGVVQSVVVAALGSFADLLLELTDGLNKPIQIPVLTPLYKKLTRGADFTILDAVSLVLAIPATFVFKIVTRKKPREIEGVGDLIKLNFMKAELDQRMGRVKQEPLLPTTQTHTMMMMTSTHAAPANTTPEKMNGDAAKTASSTPGAGTTSKKVLSDKQKEAIKFNQKRFAQSSSTVAVLLKLAVPAASSLFYTSYSWPKQLIPEEPYNPAKALISAGAKLILWLGSFVSIAKYTTEDIKTGNWDISSCWSDAQFAHRLRIWLVGGVPIIGALGGKYLGYVFSLLSSLVQTGLLLWLQIESWTASAGYSVYLAVEEWAKVVGKLASAISGLTQGGEMYGAGIALFFTTTGCGMQVVRVGLEAVGKRDVLQTGMDLVD